MKLTELFSHPLRSGGPVEKLLDAFTAYLLAAALCAGLFPFLNLGGTGRAALSAMFAMLLAMLCALKWWAAPALAGGLAAAASLAAWASGQWTAFSAYLGGLMDWCVSGLPETSAYAGDKSIWFICLAAALPAAVLALVMVRKLFSIAALAILSAIEISLLWFARSPDLQNVILFCGAMLIVSMPRAAQQRREKREGGAKMPRAPLQLLALNAALCCVVLTALIVPQGERVWRCTPLVAFLNDIGDAFQYHFGQLPFGPEFGLGRSGFEPLGDRLGGNIHPDGRKLLRISGKVPDVLRASIRDTYTGSSWTDSEGEGKFRFGSLYWSRQQKQVFESPASSLRGDARKLYEAVTIEADYEVSYIADDLYWIFTGGADSRITSMDWKDQTIYFNNQGEIYSASPLSTSFKYRAKERVFDQSLPGYERNILALEKAAKPGLFEKGPSDAYLQLPESLPDSVRETAAAAVLNAETPMEKALRLQIYLGRTGVYTQSPGTPPEDRDFVDYFLESGEGYCTYFATAMAVLARCEGIPSRYVTGYGMLESGRRDNQCYALNSSAHAWAELYFEGIGWVPFDPLFWNRPEILEPVEQKKPETAPTVPAEDAVQEERPFQGAEDLPPAVPAEKEEHTSPMAVIILLGVFLLLAVTLRFVYLRSLNRMSRLWAPARIAQRTPEPGARAERYYQDILRQLSLYGLRVQPGETLLRFAEKAGLRLPAQAEGLIQMAETITALRFGGIPPQEEALQSLALCHSAMEENLRQKFPPWEYFVRRILPSFVHRGS